MMQKAGRDVMKAIFCITAVFFLFVFFAGCNDGEQYPAVEDNSTWEKAGEPGFGSVKNYSIVAMTEYQGMLYAMTRNESEGAEIWRTDGSVWEQVMYPDNETNGIYGNPWLNCLWGEMAVFGGKLYCGFSSGVQGRVRRSTGCEIWRYDGSVWEPVISDRKDTEESGMISLISGCDAEDGELTAVFTDDSKNWTPDEWSGGVLQITSGAGRFRRFDIIGNTADSLTVQQNEVDCTANEDFTEYTVCAAQHLSNPFPPHETDIGAVQAGDTYEIGTGTDENGFGDYWNRMVTGMVIYDGKLYISTGLNYEWGGQIWYSEDGDSWSVTEPSHSFGNFHDNELFPTGKKPVSTSITDLIVSTVSGEPVLYAGGTGASGNKGRCSRVARLTDSGWELIVDAGVDADEEGSNENGFGCGMDCSMFNGDFMPWSLAEFNNRLFVGIQSLAGARVLYTETASPEDGAWTHSVGGASEMPNGFDGKRNRGNPLFYQNIAANLYATESYLYAGLVSAYTPSMGATQEHLKGAQLWKSADGLTWQPVTRNGFGDNTAVAFDAFAQYQGNLYVSINRGSIDSPHGLEPEEGCMLYRMTAMPETPVPRYSAVHSYETDIPRNESDDDEYSSDPADIYYPDPARFDNGTQPLPVAILLQGGRVDKQYYKTYAETVARYGFVVVVPNHMNAYSFGFYTPDPGYFSEMQQITDTLSFMADENTRAGCPIAGYIDTETLVMLGHSYGAACVIGAIQSECRYPFCDEGETFTRPEELKAVALCGINTKPRGSPFDRTIHETKNDGIPMAFINGALDGNAEYDITKKSYALIKDPPKALVFINGANHYAMCDINNPPGPGEDSNTPTLDQSVSIETSARWSALFLRAHALSDQDALEYIYTTGKYLDPNVEVTADPGDT